MNKNTTVKPAEAQFRRELRREEIDRRNRRNMEASKARHIAQLESELIEENQRANNAEKDVAQLTKDSARTVADLRSINEQQAREITRLREERNRAEGELSRVNSVAASLAKDLKEAREMWTDLDKKYARALTDIDELMEAAK